MRHIFRVASLVGCILLAVSLVTTANAEPVDDFWTTVRSGDDGELGTEDDIALDSTIRVVFVTSGSINGDNPNRSHYETFGNNSALSGSITGGLIVDEWQPLVSAANDTGSPVASWLEANDSPVFNTNGDRVADKGESMIGDSLTLDSAIQYDESGDAEGRSLAVWTGTESTGDPGTFQHPAVEITEDLSGALGSDNSDITGSSGDVYNSVAMVGDAESDGAEWLEFALSRQSPDDDLWDSDAPDSSGTPQFQDPVERSIYVMSGEVTVVPEPSTVLLWLGCSGLAGLIYWRKRRRS